MRSAIAAARPRTYRDRDPSPRRPPLPLLPYSSTPAGHWADPACTGPDPAGHQADPACPAGPADPSDPACHPGPGHPGPACTECSVDPDPDPDPADHCGSSASP